MLASIDSSQENDLLFDSGTVNSCWIGLNDVRSLYTFTWIDESDGTYRIFGSLTLNSFENCMYGNRDRKKRYTISCVHTLLLHLWCK